MLEFEQVFFGAYFLLEEDRIRINDEQFEGISSLIDRLEPILIDREHLNKFGFINKNGARGPMIRQTQNHTFTISPAGKVWNIGLGDQLFHTKVTYVHELQRAYFSLLGERLYFVGDEPPKPKPSILTIPEPDELNFKVIMTRSNSNRRYQKHEKQIIYSSRVDYYLVDNNHLLILAQDKQFAIWEVGDNGNLTLAAGRTVSGEQTENARKWLEKWRTNGEHNS